MTCWSAVPLQIKLRSIQLYAIEYSTFSRRAFLALHEKQLDFELIARDKQARDAAGYRALNPYGRIPTLVDADVTLYESTAILTYLEERYPEPPLIPSDAAGRARVAMYVKLCDLEFTPPAIAIQRPKRLTPDGPRDNETIATCSAAIARHYEILERELEGKDYLVNSQFTHADLVYIPFMHFHALLEVELPPNIAAWWERLSNRPSVLATVPSL